MRTLTPEAGFLLGPILLSVATILSHWIFFRPALADGQYAFIIFFTAPLGAILGVLTAITCSFLAKGDAVIAGRVAFRLGGSLFGVLLLGMFVLSGAGVRSFWEGVSATLFWCGASLLWSGVLALYGAMLLRRPPSK